MGTVNGGKKKAGQTGKNRSVAPDGIIFSCFKMMVSKDRDSSEKICILSGKTFVVDNHNDFPQKMWIFWSVDAGGYFDLMWKDQKIHTDQKIHISTMAFFSIYHSKKQERTIQLRLLMIRKHIARKKSTFQMKRLNGPVLEGGPEVEDQNTRNPVLAVGPLYPPLI